MNTIPADAILGSWMTEGWRFRVDIVAEADGYAGYLTEGLENGERDMANPDPALRGRSLLGSRLFYGLVYKDSLWKGGKLYNPENGTYYDVEMQIAGENRLDLRIFMGLRWLGITQHWERFGVRKDLEYEEIETAAGLSSDLVWPTKRAQAWYAAHPWPVGCNYIPSNAINQLEMWQRDTFTPELIAKELDLAQSLGFNTLRVYLHDILWRHDRESFINRIKRFLDLAASRGLSVMFILFDDCWNDRAHPGRQPKPRKGVHNSGWVRSPTSRFINDEKAWPLLEDYVSGIISEFQFDERVYAWDLYNEIGNSVGFLPNSTRLLGLTFRWARQMNPSQPVTAGIWKGSSWFRGLNEFLIRNSDIITFHDYSPLDTLRSKIEALSAYGKPLVCTEYMARTQNSRFETHLPLFREWGVGAMSWGLVSGKTQTIYPWGSRPGSEEPEVWFHDIFRPDGTPWSEQEVRAIRSITGLVAP
ncbi:DUF2147 domain-containing protein [Gracilinema caldarium]|uniref:DUF2147 domain-containing protein n=1 Tax=Gracilinema caldarium TaxID=215591 RepID=UPI0026E9CE16|nr:DUF2147 domain-containing protein [Gracilinema caldarium]